LETDHRQELIIVYSENGLSHFAESFPGCGVEMNDFIKIFHDSEPLIF